jgi:RNA polymerase sigma-70 factor (ECF subfamily)
MRNRRFDIENYTQRLFGYALSLTGDHARAEDLVHDTVARALGARNTPEDEPAYRAWLFRILRNRFLDDERRRKGRSDLEESDVDETQVPDWNFANDIVSVLTVRAALSQLPTGQREIITLIDVAGFSYREAADVLDVPTGTVMSRISRARSALASKLANSNVRALPRRREGSV